MVLLIGEYGSHLHVEHFKNVGSELVRIHIFIIAVEGKVAQDDVFRSVQNSVLQVVLSHIDGQKVITVHN